ncbi:hypothetical protein RS9916_31272 [Synechococcus sp. RS9916]|nr:hypothetical protein RS9916_31272 [Synechococcus sp. RS9916]
MVAVATAGELSPHFIDCSGHLRKRWPFF